MIHVQFVSILLLIEEILKFMMVTWRGSLIVFFIGQMGCVGMCQLNHNIFTINFYLTYVSLIPLVISVCKNEQAKGNIQK